MKQLLKGKLLSNFIIYGASNALGSGLPLLLLPFLTRYLAPADLAMIAIFHLFYSVLTPFVGLNGVSLTSVIYYQRKAQEFKNHLSSYILLIIFSTILVALLCSLFSTVIYEYTGLQVKWVLLVCVYLFFEKFSELLLSLFRLQNTPWKFAVFRFTRVILELALAVTIVLYFNTSWEGRVESILIAGIGIGVLSIALILRRLGWSLIPTKKDIKEITSFGAPLIPHVMSGVMINYADTLFVRNMVSEAALGLYSVGYQVGMTISLVQNSFNQAWVPWFFEKLSSLTQEWKNKIVKLTYLYFLTLLVLAVFIAIITPWIFSIFIDERFEGAQQYVIWIAMGFAFNGMYKMVVNYLIFKKLTSLVSSVTLGVAAVNLILNYVLIKSNGAIGAAQSTTISFLLEFIIIWIISAQVFPMNWLTFYRKQ